MMYNLHAVYGFNFKNYMYYLTGVVFRDFKLDIYRWQDHSYSNMNPVGQLVLEYPKDIDSEQIIKQSIYEKHLQRLVVITELNDVIIYQIGQTKYYEEADHNRNHPYLNTTVDLVKVIRVQRNIEHVCTNDDNKLYLGLEHVSHHHKGQQEDRRYDEENNEQYQEKNDKLVHSLQQHGKNGSHFKVHSEMDLNLIEIDLDDYLIKYRYKHFNSSITAMDSIDDEHLIVGFKNGDLLILDQYDNIVLKLKGNRKRISVIQHMRLHHRVNLIVCGSDNGHLHIYKLNFKQQLDLHLRKVRKLKQKHQKQYKEQLRKQKVEEQYPIASQHFHRNSGYIKIVQIYQEYSDIQIMTICNHNKIHHAIIAQKEQTFNWQRKRRHAHDNNYFDHEDEFKQDL